jgi:hypothetical protein
VARAGRGCRCHRSLLPGRRALGSAQAGPTIRRLGPAARDSESGAAFSFRLKPEATRSLRRVLGLDVRPTACRLLSSVQRSTSRRPSPEAWPPT